MSMLFKNRQPTIKGIPSTMKLADLMLVAVCLTVAGCSAPDPVSPNSSTPQPTNAGTAAANSNAVNAAGGTPAGGKFEGQTPLPA